MAQQCFSGSFLALGESKHSRRAPSALTLQRLQVANEQLVKPVGVTVARK